MNAALRRLAILAVLASSALAAAGALAASDVVTAGTSTAPRLAARDTALFAGGCFWSMEYGFEGRPGVIDVSSGYSGGHTVNPTYDDVNTETTGHMETVQVIFDPHKVSYGELLDLYWHRTDPTQADGQFCDHGDSYHPAIFWRNERQHAQVEASKAALEKSGILHAKVVTYVRKAGPFYRAEEYHQDFYKKNALHYHAYSMACGRDRSLDAMWGKLATHAVVP
jgi:peptide-methionine (S)-S-oxide reductase